MIDNIIESFKNVFSPEVIIFIISMCPILELRGGLIAAAILKVDLLVAFPICVLGNMLPIPLILLFIRRIIEWLKHFKRLNKLAVWIENKANAKSGNVGKYMVWGLFIFVGIPLPGTGAWTGALVADALNIRMKRALPAIFAGVVMAGVIISLVSYGLWDIIVGLFK